MVNKVKNDSIILSFFLILFFTTSCSNSEKIKVHSANFEVSSEIIYLAQPCIFEAVDTMGKQNYKWNFGDGTFLKDQYKISHQYMQEGTYNTILSIGGLQQLKTIQVLPGRISYQIENNSDHYLDVLIYLNNYNTGCTKRMLINANDKSNIIYATSNHFDQNSSFSHSHIFGISIFIENSEYTLPDMLWIKDFEHHSITINNSTMLIPRSSHGDSKEVMLKDLFLK